MLLKDWLYENRLLLLKNKTIFDWTFGPNNYLLRVISAERVEYKRDQSPWNATRISDLRKFNIQQVSIGKRKIVGSPTIRLITDESH